MQAQDVKLTELLLGPKQFIVPVFQRDYSWGTKHCLQLWKDIMRIGTDDAVKAHFVGSVVYIAAEDTSAKITRWLLIDGQQRLTTLSLLLIALRNKITSASIVDTALDDPDAFPTPAELNDHYLINAYGQDDRRYKLHLRRADHQTLSAILESNAMPGKVSESIVENLRFFDEQLTNADIEAVYRGIRKLVAVDVSLTKGQDDPQMIFESLNSTGLDLTQADLIRNFVLMRQDEEAQTRLYTEYWQPIELAFGPRYRSEFDKFARDFLTLKLQPSKPIRNDDIYYQFRSYFEREKNSQSEDSILAELQRYGSYYVAFSLGGGSINELKAPFARLGQLIEVASPVVLKLYDCFARENTLSLTEFIAAVELLESYVFRRSVCDMQTRNLGQIFASLAARIKRNAPLLSLKVALFRQSSKRRFPADIEFCEALETRDVYDMRQCHYLLTRLENDSKEKVDTSNLTIEHVLPQNEELGREWQSMLGENWEETRELWLHRLGNITLTGYNSEYSDLPFEKKKMLKDKEGRRVGFDFSPLRLNQYIREQVVWTEHEIGERGRKLAADAIRVWPSLVVDHEAVKAAELEERKAYAAKFSIDALGLDDEARKLFDLLRPQIFALNENVIELCSSSSVTYRVYDYFVEVIPRRRRLALLLNHDFDDCDDPSQLAEDATQYAFIPNASESGGVLYSLSDDTQIASAMHMVRQAYENVAE